MVVPEGFGMRIGDLGTVFPEKLVFSALVDDINNNNYYFSIIINLLSSFNIIILIYLIFFQGFFSVAYVSNSSKKPCY